jgi:hypothetical protein
MIILVPDREIKRQTLKTLRNFTANVAVLADGADLGDTPRAWCKVDQEWTQAEQRYLDSSAYEQGVTHVFKYFSDKCPSEISEEDFSEEKDCWEIDEFLELTETFRDAFKTRGIQKEGGHEEVKHARPYFASTKDIEALSDKKWHMLVVCTYQQLLSSSRGEQSIVDRLGPLDMVIMDEAHRVINHTDGKLWKNVVTKICQKAEKVYAFSGSPLEKARLEGLDFEEVKWTTDEALRSGEIVRFEPLPVDAHVFDTLLADDDEFFRLAVKELKRKGTQKTRYLGMRRDITIVLALVGLMVWNNRCFRLSPGSATTSPWVNTLLVTDKNKHGSDLKTLIDFVKKKGGPLLEK